ncbi:alanine racemase [Leucobacter sp. W1478]|uniref:alanine racemase n=1 Tax=Leucobacter sp. W1478 TaxID=3439065 RepID=UPI003F3B8012
MTLDLAAPSLRARGADRPWSRPAEFWPGLTAATADLSAPLVALSLEALSANAADLLRRAGGLPIRIASKSIRVRGVLDAVLALPGYRGVLAYTLPEALWLAETVDDVVVGYPTVDRAAIAALGSDARAASRITLMIDSVEQLDLIDAISPHRTRESIRVCLDFDASWDAPLLGHVGVLRSPVRTAEALRALAEQVACRPGYQLVGVMSYEAQIAGVANAPSGRPILGAALRAMQRASSAELRERRAQAIAAVHQVSPLEFVNAGGTGSLEHTAAEASVTEVTAGSGLFGPHLFDHYREFIPAPAVAIALDVVRRPRADTVTLLGGGWSASGAPGVDRLPQVVWPERLRLSPREGAGEVQTPVRGAAVSSLALGDRVWLRHTKSGEPMEHVREVVPVSAGMAGDPLATYRGEGRSFL